MEKIQTGRQGHCSEEDSLACMKLVQHRLTKHLYYGDAVMNNVYSEIRAYPEMATSHFATSMLRQCVKMDKKAGVVGLEEAVDRYQFYINKGDATNIENISCISEIANKEVVNKCCEDLLKHDLNIAHLLVTDSQLEGTNGKIFRCIDKWVKDIYEKTINSSLIIVLFGGHKQGNGVCFVTLKKEFIQ